MSRGVMIIMKLRYESLIEDSTPHFAVIDLNTNEIYCDGDDMVELFLFLQGILNNCSIGNDGLVRNKISKS